MAAAGNYRHSQESMDDTFYLTNIVPQNFQNNEKYTHVYKDYMLTIFVLAIGID